MLRPLGLACTCAAIGAALAACAGILGDFEIVPDAAPDGSSSPGDASGAETSTPIVEAGVDAGPQPIPRDIAVSQYASCATLEYPSATRTFCWGGATPPNKEHLGVPASEPPIGAGFYRPRLVASTNDLTFEKIYGTGSGGWFIASGTDVSGTPDAISWGSNLFAQSGQDADAGAVLPARLRRDDDSVLHVTAASGGPRHGCIVEEGKLYCWGQDEHCQSGAGVGDACTSIGAPIVKPRATVALKGNSVFYDRVATGDAHTCVLARENGNAEAAGVYCFGDNRTFLQCGKTSLIESFGLAQRVEAIDLGKAVEMEVAAGDNHTCAIVKRNKLVCWGSNSSKQTDPAGTTDPKPPAEIVLGDAGASQLSMLRLAGDATCVVAGPADVRSRIYCFGSGELGRPGQGVLPIEGIVDIKGFSLSHTHGCAIARESATTELGVYCWGSNAARAVDPSTTESSPTPRRVLFPATP